MKLKTAPPVNDLARRLAEAEATIAALISGQVDAVVDATSQTPVLLAEAQRALRQSQGRLRDIIDGLGPSMFVGLLTPAGILLEANRPALEAAGLRPDDVIGKPFETSPWWNYSPEARLQMHNTIARGARGEASRYDVEVGGVGTARIAVDFSMQPLRDDQGRVAFLVPSAIVITDRKQAENALRVAEESMRFALTNANIGIWDMDSNTGMVRWSTILEAQYGLQAGTFVGTFEAFVGHIHPEDRDAALAIVRAAMKSGADFSLLTRAILPDGSIRWLAGQGRFLLSAEGNPVRGVGISQDVTERQTLERQYLQAQKMEAIGQLASGVAHDFNNLLTVILGFSQIVSSDEHMTAENKSDLDEVVKAAMRASGLTKQLLAFSRQQVLHAVAIDVNTLITEMIGMLRRLIGENIEVTVTLAPTLTPAFADRGQIEQVVMNLAVNAKDAMPGGGTLTVVTSEVDITGSSSHQDGALPGHYVVLTVTDTGSGMTKETQQRLFEPFFTTKDPGKGTGLGLSTIYGIVKQSKGHIVVCSTIGRGTTFTVYLPCATSEVMAPVVRVEVPTPVAPATETVLLVEDEVGVRRLTKRVLEGAGYRVLEATNGETAERVFADHAAEIHLLVTDVIMPVCGGPELLRRLRERTPTLKVLYMSGYTEQTTAHEAGLDRGLPFAQKPFTSATLLRKVREALNHQTS